MTDNRTKYTVEMMKAGLSLCAIKKK